MGIQVDLRNAIVARMNSVDEVGVVHEKTIYANSQDTFLDNFATIIDGNRQIRGWWVSPPTVFSAANPNIEFNVETDTLDYAVHAVMGMSINSDSETEFTDLVYRTRDALRVMVDWGLTEVIKFSTIVTVPTLDLRQFGSVLCHYCELHVQVNVGIDIDVFGGWVVGAP